MSLPAAYAAAESHELAPLVADPIVIALVMAAVFLVLGMVTYSHRDVANRHNDKVPGDEHGQAGPH